MTTLSVYRQNAPQDANLDNSTHGSIHEARTANPFCLWAGPSRAQMKPRSFELWELQDCGMQPEVLRQPDDDFQREPERGALKDVCTVAKGGIALLVSVSLTWECLLVVDNELELNESDFTLTNAEARKCKKESRGWASPRHYDIVPYPEGSKAATPRSKAPQTATLGNESLANKDKRDNPTNRGGEMTLLYKQKDQSCSNMRAIARNVLSEDSRIFFYVSDPWIGKETYKDIRDPT
ncbi:hypothetical protein K503DRAFT_781379 [Rhizopogon vinicolor AM-OR11-026]|uniref:Uncharacterized protein n=1 Tax=Rhizopogon vinicolor AM-OR11-026 TaxID=1314800 RepID=A0A1B7N6M8_9AGAM|nr:hypothetical protein K503DRAFT_781379 [Rhizopogon vinicolor AM-OR11-026]